MLLIELENEPVSQIGNIFSRKFGEMSGRGKWAELV